MKKQKLSEKEINEKLNDLKMQILKQDSKRKGLKKEIARLLTSLNQIKLNDGGKEK